MECKEEKLVFLQKNGRIFRKSFVFLLFVSSYDIITKDIGQTGKTKRIQEANT